MLGNCEKMKTQSKTKNSKHGQLPPGWEMKILENVANVNELTINKDFSHDKIEYIDIASVEQGKIIESKKITLCDAPSRAQRILRKNDTIISTVRPNLKHFAFIKEVNLNTIASTGFAVISAKSIDPRFLYYYLSTDKYTDYLSAIADAHTSTYPAFNPDILENSIIPYPPITEQKAIAKILSDLDDKIELNQQMNNTLKSIAQAIFKHWFIDFEFPFDFTQGKPNEHDKPCKSSGRKMGNSELGKIPEGWQVKEIKDCSNIICGKTPPTKDNDNYGNDVFFITIPDMRNQTFVINTERKLSQKGTALQKNKELPKLSICVSCIATPGLVSLTSDISHTNQQINSIVTNKDISPFFMYYTMLTKSEDIKTMGLGGTATLNLNTGNFGHIKIVIPDYTSTNAFHKIITPLMERILMNSKENMCLCDIRDSLLPKLISGEIQVKI
jgi:type I restriction enzyme S subunit